ncbi:uncharacterized protein BXZ73DRAFT_104521 [Epithele typhae]|uniref:uncharacterized protein n=1 Tax=Epithele typhae TaxID=378194 RepID=UPI0020083E6F|nr:uncharacterized protein BXZ73DRAFT_104521 [Epithele typhae]KAH9921232.1 hypothetical protein BXZ73DRAFT_104521 [Epithele typhae]
MYAQYLDTFGNILTATKNLRILNFEVGNTSFILHPPVTRALAQMHELRYLSCHLVSPGVLSVVKCIPSRNLVLLDLWHEVQWFHDFSPLLSTLEAFSKLSTLVMNSFLPGQTDLDTAGTSLPSIRHITLKDASVAATNILYLCPNIDTIDFSPNHEQQCMQGHTDIRPRWPKVSHLSVGICRATRWGGGVDARLSHADLQTALVELLERRASPVPHLELAGGGLELTRDGVAAVDAATSRWLARLLAALQPRALTLPVHAAGFNQSPHERLDGWLWIQVARVLPRLRALTLRRVGRDNWVPPDTPPAALAELPLRCLFIDASPVLPSESRRLRSPCVELERVRALDALPAKLLAALTEMRVLGITGTAALPDAAVDTSEKWGLKDLGEWRREHGEHNTPWWRVDGEGAERKLVELWREYGERAQQLVENAEEYRVADLAEIYLDKCRYEP